MSNEILSLRYNVMNISSVDGFCNIRGGFNKGCKDVYFVRIVGIENSLAEKIAKMDSCLSASNTFYNRVSELPKLASADDVAYYNNCLKDWKNSGQKRVALKKTLGEFLEQLLSSALVATLEVFSSAKAGVSESMKDNFAVKLLYWFDNVVPDFNGSYSGKESVKLCSENVSGIQNYLFFHMLTKCGFDVLLLQIAEDIDSALDKYNFSVKATIGEFGRINLPRYNPSATREEKAAPIHRETVQPVIRDNIRVTIPPHREKIPAAVAFSDTRPTAKASAEKSMEELAKLASSVVMIAVHNRNGEVIGTGSGIMISEKGYILTNNHVAKGGRFYSVRIEDDDEVYQTDEIIKYNPVIDLALIRINRRLKPIPVYNAGKLVRGQKVVAIGSPLGLFNTVSDGIISGFRDIDGVGMIQFTAPISHGSSGGAILNMNGQVIGISTAGIDAGQNLNLAVSYDYINAFLMGLK